MEYKGLNDNELIYLCNENNEDAQLAVINKYRPIILSTLKDYLKEYNIIGLEMADLYQEGLIGLIHAIKTYDEKKDILFYTYAIACIKTSMMSGIRQAFRKKNRILNNSYSLDKLIEESNNTFYDFVKAENSDPNEILLNNEEKDSLINTVKNKLSKSERVIFELKLKGLNNTEISDLIDKDKKYVENTMFRINKKYKELFKDKK